MERGEVSDVGCCVLSQVYVLGRMGSARQALALIISKLADIPQARSHPRLCIARAHVSAYIYTLAGGPDTSCCSQQPVLGRTYSVLGVRRVHAQAVPAG